MSDSLEPFADSRTPEVMFLPLAVHPKAKLQDVDLQVLARRLPDFVHQVLNQGALLPTAMLELQTSDKKGATWLRLDAPPDREEAFDLVPENLQVRAVVAGALEPRDGDLLVEFLVWRAKGDSYDELLTEKVGGTVSLKNPVPVLLRLARHLARLLGIDFREPPRGLLTDNGLAFRQFLHGLDNAMLLSGDLDIAVPEDRMALMQPFVDALALDPSFGLALRVASSTAELALGDRKLDAEAVRSFLDACYRALPADGEGCVAIADQLSDLGDEKRALAWLEHAAHLDSPPARGLENLGLLHAKQGNTRAAIDTWERGLAVDGSPVFFAHLAQVRFAQDREPEGWDLARRGLVRLRERLLRRGEFDADPDSDSWLLEALEENLREHQAPPDVMESLLALQGLLRDRPRVYFALCLAVADCRQVAEQELNAAMDDFILGEERDRVVRALLRLQVAGFEARFAQVVAGVMRGRNPRRFAPELREWYRLQDEFWPAQYYLGVIERREGDLPKALDHLFEAQCLEPDQADVNLEMAAIFAQLGNPKRALELVNEGSLARSSDPRVVASKGNYLLLLGRAEEARDLLRRAFAAGLDTRELRALGRRLR